MGKEGITTPPVKNQEITKEGMLEILNDVDLLWVLIQNIPIKLDNVFKAFEDMDRGEAEILAALTWKDEVKGLTGMAAYIGYGPGSDSYDPNKPYIPIRGYHK